MLVYLILGKHLAGFQAILADLISHWQEIGEFLSTLAGLSKKISLGIIQGSKAMEKEDSNGKKVMSCCCKMICRPCAIASCRHCIRKYNSLSYSCIYIPGSPEPPKWISCGPFL